MQILTAMPCLTCVIFTLLIFTQAKKHFERVRVNCMYMLKLIVGQAEAVLILPRSGHHVFPTSYYLYMIGDHICNRGNWQAENPMTGQSMQWNFICMFKNFS